MRRPSEFRRVQQTAWWRHGKRRVEGVVFAVFHWLAPHVRGLYSAVGIVLLVGLGLALVALWGFAKLADSVLEGETLALDHFVMLWINQHATPWLDAAALEVTALGSVVVVATVILVATAFLWFTHRRAAILLLWGAVAGSVFLNLILKRIFERPRPTLFEWRTEYVGFSSFPSGHAMVSMVVYTILAYLIIDLDPPRQVKHTTVALAAIIITLVGLSRVYLGVHYPTDILAGYAVGFAWASLCAFGLRAVLYVHERINSGNKKAA